MNPGKGDRLVRPIDIYPDYRARQDFEGGEQRQGGFLIETYFVQIETDEAVEGEVRVAHSIVRARDLAIECEQQRQGNTAGGAIVGALAGGLLGNAISRGPQRGAGTAVGAIFGGLLGASIGNNLNCEQRSYAIDANYRCNR